MSKIDFETLKAEMILNGELFRDSEIEHDRNFLFFTRKEIRDETLERLVWRRPTEIVNNPKFMVEGASQCDFCQGKVGDCWFLSAAATLATQKLLLKRVVPADQTFEKGEYAGIFRFRFWRFGEWKEVIIDDRLPVDSKDGSLLFVKNKRVANEFWAALMEKAYAKLHKSYEALSGGLPHDALVDFTGGVTEYVRPLPKEPEKQTKLFNRLLRFQEMQTLMATGIFVKPDGEMEEKLSTGLVAGHAYSVTKVTKVDFKQKPVRLIRLRNPWGEKEWTGAWSDESIEWIDITDTERKRLDLVKEDDGEFWMTFEDFCKNYDFIDICHMGIEDPDNKFGRKRWHMTTYHGEWVKGVSAGGTRLLEETPLPSKDDDPYWCNPQYVLCVRDPDPEDSDLMATLVVSLIQKHRRVLRSVMQRSRSLDNYMGFDLLKVPVSDLDDLLKGRGAMAVASRMSFILRKSPKRHREASAVYRVPPGIYCLVVSYGLPNHSAKYVLRIATEKPIVTGPQLAVPTQASLNLKRLGDELGQLFKKHSGGDKYVDAAELSTILNKGLMEGDDVISLETCRVLIGASSTAVPGKLDYDLVKIQWKLVKEHVNSFGKFDVDESGAIGVVELGEALESLGIDLGRKAVRSLGYRYGGKHARVHFDDFIQCSVRLIKLIEAYQEIILKLHHPARIGLDEWLEKLLLC